MIRAKDMKTTMALAQYAADTVWPLVDQLPEGSLELTVYAGDQYLSNVNREWSVCATVRKNSGIGNQRERVAYGNLCVTSEEIDWLAREVRGHIEREAAA